MPPKVPQIMPAVRIRTQTTFGNLHLSIVVDTKSNKELEIFAWIGRCGDLTMCDLEGICRISSLYLRSGAGTIQDIIKQLKGIGTHLSTKEQTSIPDCLGKALETYLVTKEKFGLEKLLRGEHEDGEAKG